MSTLIVLKDIWNSLIERTRVRRIVFSLFTLIIWCSIVLPISITMLNSVSEDSLEQLTPGTIKSLDPSIIYMQFYFQNIDIQKKTASLYISMAPFGGLLDNRYRLKESITCDFRYKMVKLEKGKTTPSLAMTIPLVTSSTKNYPFETLETFLPVFCKSEEGDPVELFIISQKVLQTYERNSTLKKYKDLLPEEQATVFREIANEDAYIMFFTFTQPTRTKFYILIISLSMWGLTLGLLNISLNVIIDKRDPLPSLALGAGILFALPTLRATQPGVPGLGCLADILAFLWCISLTALFTIINLYSYAFR